RLLRPVVAGDATPVRVLLRPAGGRHRRRPGAWRAGGARARPPAGLPRHHARRRVGGGALAAPARPRARRAAPAGPGAVAALGGPAAADVRLLHDPRGPVRRAATG